MNREQSWENSVGIAQSYWENITHQSYKQAPKPFLNKMRELNFKVFAVDWQYESTEAKNMKNLFEKGFAGDITSLKKAFDLGVNVRNTVMAKNIYQILNTKDKNAKPICKKALMFVGGLHLAEDIVMPMGRTKYQSIASHPLLKNYLQVAHEILDCNKLNSINSKENQEQCHHAKTFKEKLITMENIFSSKDLFEIAVIKSVSQTVASSLSSVPKIIYNIMILD